MQLTVFGNIILMHFSFLPVNFRHSAFWYYRRGGGDVFGGLW